MNKRTMACAVAALLLPVLAACGSPTTEPSRPAPSTSTSSLPTIGAGAVQYDPNVPVNNGDPITISFWYPDPGEGYSAYVDAVKDYEAIHPNVTFDVNSALGWSDYWSKLPVAVSSGTGPDLMHFHLNWYGDFVPGLLEPFPTDFADALKQDFTGIDPMTYDDEVYMVPIGNMTGAMFYNKDMWTAAGLTDADIPQTWDDLLAVAERLTVRDGEDVEVSGFGLPDGWLLLGLNYQKGHFLYQADGKRTQLNNPGAIEAAQVLQSFTQKRVNKASSESGSDQFVNQKAAIIYAWTWMGGYLDSNVKDSFEWGVFPTPTFGDSQVVDRNNPDVSPVVSSKSDAQHKEVAMDFLKFYFASDKYLLGTNDSGNLFPTKTSLATDPTITGNEVLSVVSTYIDKTVWVGVTPSVLDTSVSQTLTDGLLFQGKDPAEQLALFDQLNAADADQVEIETAERRSPLAQYLQ